MVHIQPSAITKMFRTVYTIHPYFSHFSGYPDFQKNSTLHIPLNITTDGDIAMSSAIKVPT